MDYLARTTSMPHYLWFTAMLICSFGAFWKVYIFCMRNCVSQFRNNSTNGYLALVDSIAWNSHTTSVFRFSLRFSNIWLNVVRLEYLALQQHKENIVVEHPSLGLDNTHVSNFLTLRIIVNADLVLNSMEFATIANRNNVSVVTVDMPKYYRWWSALLIDFTLIF